jgi:hypothetical protein
MNFLKKLFPKRYEDIMDSFVCPKGFWKWRLIWFLAGNQDERRRYLTDRERYLAYRLGHKVIGSKSAKDLRRYLKDARKEIRDVLKNIADERQKRTGLLLRRNELKKAARLFSGTES